MNSFQKVPVVLSPFASKADEIEDEFIVKPSTGQQPYVISYEYGLGSDYAKPMTDRHIRLQRKEMNRMGYDATVGTYRKFLGYGDTFNPDLCTQIQGYPKGALLRWYQFAPVVSDVGIPSTLQISFNGVVGEITDDTISKFKQGDVGVLPGTGLYLFTTDPSHATTLRQLDDYAILVVISSVIEVVSTVDGNTADFRTIGPSSQNGWKAVDEADKVKEPAYHQAFNDSSVFAEGGGSGSFALRETEVQHDGWIMISCEREMEGIEFSTIGRLLDSYSDGFRYEIRKHGGEVVLASGEEFFGASDQIYKTVPVSAGMVVSFSVTNSVGTNTRLTSYLIGTI